MPPKFKTEQLLSIGPWSLDTATGECFMDGRSIHLGPREVQVVTKLRPHDYRTFEAIQFSVAVEDNPEVAWRDDIPLDSLFSKDSLYFIISSLRKKLGRDTIECMKSVGYRLKLK